MDCINPKFNECGAKGHLYLQLFNSGLLLNSIVIHIFQLDIWIDMLQHEALFPRCFHLWVLHYYHVKLKAILHRSLLAQSMQDSTTRRWHQLSLYDWTQLLNRLVLKSIFTCLLLKHFREWHPNLGLTFLIYHFAFYW